MGKKVDTKRFENLVRKAEAYNRTNSGLKRFYPIQSRDGKILVFGMYDYAKKRHVVSRPFEDINSVFDEIEAMLNNA